MSELTHYEVLEITRTSTLPEIQKAYRNKSLLYHPDKNPDPSAAALLDGVQRAYTVLSDAAARKAYDELLKVLDAEKVAEANRSQALSKLRHELDEKQKNVQDAQDADRERVDQLLRARACLEHELDRLHRNVMIEKRRREEKELGPVVPLFVWPPKKRFTEAEVRHLEKTIHSML